MMNLVESRNDRTEIENNSDNVLEMLRTFGQVADYMTELMIADFYRVRIDTIHKSATRHKKELEKYGYRVIKGEELKELRKVQGGFYKISSKTSALRLYPIEAVLFIGLNYLTDSKIADKIKSELPKISPDLFLKLSKGKSIKRQEIEFINQGEKALKSFNIQGEKQFKVLSYRIDYYIPSLNIAIEYDENDHSNYSYETHEGRQQEIERELGCRFIRVSDKNSDAYNIGLVIKNIFNK